MTDSVRRSTPATVAERAALFAVLALGALVRFAHLGGRSLWTDEGSTWTAVSLPLSKLLERCLVRDASPPLFYLLTAWATRFGNDEAHLRTVSALASCVLVGLTYLLARLALPRTAATFAALLCALSPFQVLYAQEARTYALVAMFSVAATLLFARSMEAVRRTHWSGYALATAAGLWTQSIALLALPAQGLIVLFTRSGRRVLLAWLTAVGAAVLLYAPWGWASRAMAEHLASSHWYVPDTDAGGLFKVLRAILLSPTPIVTAPPGSPLPGLDAWLPRPLAWALLVGPVALALAAAAAVGFVRDARGALARLAFASWLVPLAAVLVMSLRSPLFLARYFVFATPYVAVGLALGAWALPGRVLRALVGALLLGAQAFALVHASADASKEPWRDVAATIRAAAVPGETAVLVPFDVDPMAFYLRDGHSGVTAIEVSHPDEPFAAHFTPRQLDELTDAARKHSQEFDDVWVVVRSPNSAVRREVARRAEAVAAEGRSLLERRRWDSYGGPLRVSHWRRPARAPRGTPTTP